MQVWALGEGGEEAQGSEQGSEEEEAPEGGQQPPEFIEEVAEQATREEKIELAQLRRHKRATQIRHGPLVMPEGYTPRKHRYSLRGPAQGVGFRRRTDYADDPWG